jgi:hypothetical protein
MSLPPVRPLKDTPQRVWPFPNKIATGDAQTTPDVITRGITTTDVSGPGAADLRLAVLDDFGGSRRMPRI